MKYTHCCYCKEKLSRMPQSRFCWPCHEKRNPYVWRAIIAVRKAVRSGKLAPVAGKLCVDCGAPARDYDHRDYAKPIDVEPVCRSCNHRRGPAKFPMQVAA